MRVDIYSTDKKYNIIYADPPWKYQDKGCNGNCESHYNTMNLESIEALGGGNSRYLRKRLCFVYVVYLPNAKRRS